MTIKNGVDIIEVERIRNAVKNPRFMDKVFSEDEQKFFSLKKFPHQSMAANFAAKEAFAKTLSTGFRGFSPNEISVLRDDAGAPYIKLTGNALKAAEGFEFSISLSHTDNIACAFVTAYK